MGGLRMLGLSVACAIVAGCARNVRAIQPVAQVNLPRFMGDWYVIASIPSLLEKRAYNAVESYELSSNGHIQTTFRYRNNGFDAPLKTMHPVGTVRPDTHNAVWSMQFIWPIEAEYIVAHLDDNYSETIIARNKRDYVWIMARTPSIPQQDYDALVERVRQLGYSTETLRKVPQQWPELGPKR
ncbi:MAG TPA: lipocalin family protein [Steroidobacteraceae bacterium]